MVELENRVEWKPEDMIEVRLKTPDDFFILREILTRIGVASKEKKLFQSCHILHKQGTYFIVHFKELIALDGNVALFREDDLKRRNRIIMLLEEWELVSIADESKKEHVYDNATDLRNIKVLPIHEKDKDNWTLVPKYVFARDRLKASRKRTA